MTKYKDKNGQEIQYSDVLKLVNYGKYSENQPKEPYLTLIKQDGKDMLYISGMDEYQDIEGWQTEEDKKNDTISSLEIFCTLKHLYSVAISKLPYAICLTFDEVKRINEFIEEKIKSKDYGFAPCVQIIMTPQENFPEYQTVEVCTIHDITKALDKAKETGIYIKPHIDITDEMKSEMI